MAKKISMLIQMIKLTAYSILTLDHFGRADVIVAAFDRSHLEIVMYIHNPKSMIFRNFILRTYLYNYDFNFGRIAKNLFPNFVFIALKK